MYYTNGNYEAFARPRKPEGVENKQAYLVGGGLASLALPPSSSAMSRWKEATFTSWRGRAWSSATG